MNISFIGDTATGKSHILHTLISPEKEYNPILTVGIDYKSYIYNNTIYNFWDCAGSKRIFNALLSILPKFNKTIIVCNLYNRQSIEQIEYYKNFLSNNTYILVNTHMYNKQETSSIQLLDKLYQHKYIIIDSNDVSDFKKKIEHILNN